MGQEEQDVVSKSEHGQGSSAAHSRPSVSDRIGVDLDAKPHEITAGLYYTTNGGNRAELKAILCCHDELVEALRDLCDRAGEDSLAAVQAKWAKARAALAKSLPQKEGGL
jgi:hypothetical protein